MAQSKSEEKTAAFNQDSGKPGGYARKPVTMKDYLMLMQPYIPSGLSLFIWCPNLVKFAEAASFDQKISSELPGPGLVTGACWSLTKSRLRDHSV